MMSPAFHLVNCVLGCAVAFSSRARNSKMHANNDSMNHREKL